MHIRDAGLVRKRPEQESKLTVFLHTACVSEDRDVQSNAKNLSGLTSEFVSTQAIRCHGQLCHFFAQENVLLMFLGART